MEGHFRFRQQRIALPDDNSEVEPAYPSLVSTEAIVEMAERGRHLKFLVN
jgi:hypothetical protein